MTGHEKDPAVNGLEIICWYQDFMTNPASRARKIAASNLFFQAQAYASAHASAHASTPASAELSPFLESDILSSVQAP